MNPRNNPPTVTDQDDTPLIGADYPHGRGTGFYQPVKVRRERPWLFWLFLCAAWALIIGLWVLIGA